MDSATVLDFDGGNVTREAVGTKVVYIGFANRSTQYECILSLGLPYSDVLTVANFCTAMRLPPHWREGMDVSYVAEKLGKHGQMNEVDAEGIVKMLRYAALKYPESA